MSLSIPNLVKSAAAQGACGFAGSILFNVCNPAAGAVYGATQSAMYTLLSPGISQFLSFGDSTPSKVYVFVVNFLITACISISLGMAMGFPISLPAAAYLSIVMIPTSYLIDYLFGTHISIKA